jgi:thiol-disulfide isomerase/thioredoxin
LLTGVFVGVVGVGLALAWAMGGSVETAETGHRAPDFTVELLSGSRFSLSGHLEEDGRPLIVNLWASWCAPCRDEIPALSAFAADNPEVTVIGVAVEDRPEDSRLLAEQLRPSYPLALGDAEFEAAYPNFGLPITYFLDGSGVVTEVYNGILTREKLDERLP